MEHHLLCTFSSLLLLFLFCSIPVTSQFTFGSSSKQAHNYSNVSCVENERQALLQFKHGLIDESNRLSSWIGESCCSWKGISCHKTTGTILKLDLHNTVPLYSDDDDFLCKNCLGGQLSPSLVHLTNLRYLDLSSNNFSGIQVPAFLGLLKNLRYLNLSSTGFDGEIPRHLGNLSHLRYLDLGNFVFSSIQNSLSTKDLGWVAGLSSLEGLVLSRVNLTAAQDGLHLHDLRLGFNNLSDPIHGLLTYLCLSANNLQGSIPSEIGQLRKLTNLLLSFNKLNGTIPTNLWQLTKLQTFEVGYNSLTGVLSEDHFAKLRELESLDLAGNSLALNVSSSWHSQIASVDYLLRLRYISLSSNKLDGSLKPFPLDISILDLSHNFLTGHIPQLEVGQTSVVRSLSLNDNRFTGTIPEDLCKMEYLSELDLSNNLLSERVPLCLGNLRDLEFLNLANNSLSGQIPSSLGNLWGLSKLLLNGNKLVGKLPASMQHLRNLKILDLGDNELKDIIPAWIGERLSNLMCLRFQSNNFHGAISDTLCQLSQLQLLNLAHNNLSGFIPHCFNNISAMVLGIDGEYYAYHVYIFWSLHPFEFINKGNFNIFIGSITDDHFCHFYTLINIFIDSIFIFFSIQVSSQFPFGSSNQSYNYLDLSWYIVHEKMLSSLMCLGFQSNNLHGAISDTLYQLSHLRVLNLAHNNLSRFIPHCFNNINRQLEALDLSMNVLFGAIPESLSDLYSLNSLYLSHNKLSGPIPSGNQLQTLTNPSIYEGNSGLCGKPLQNNCLEHKLSTKNGSSHDHKGHSKSDWSWFYAGIGPGFAVGRLEVLGILL
ncbi:unnamed protein product [Coffea canephora]|uniref:Leucine-rich repeat-containing N-terminal plant-type domain-containing protein n=1 Tax=Coffea canephora TaxID=49390 RepID=A0A068UBF0_COFCA|nr:unnamed protein product [Coffea canephora]